MSARCFRNTVWGLCLAIALIGCSSADLKRAAADPPYDVFDAVRAANVPDGSSVRIDCAVPGEIQIVVYPGDEVALDIIPTGWGDDIGRAANEAHQKIDVEMEVAILATGKKQIIITAQFDTELGSPDWRDRLTMHLRVPPRVNINVNASQVQTATTNLVVEGEVEWVKAELNKGNITVRGAVGGLSLSTHLGNIQVDARGSRPDPPNRLELHARGNIDLFSVSNSVSAQAESGNVRFVGALAGGDNSFVTTGAGNVVVAIPDDVPHEFEVRGGSQVVTDYASDALVCGFIEGAGSEAIDESFRTSQDSIGYVNFTHMITLTDYVSGVLSPQKYIFHTNRGTVTKYLPSKGTARREGDRSLQPDVGRCNEAAQPSAVRFNVAAQKGEVYIRLIHKLPDK